MVIYLSTEQGPPSTGLELSASLKKTYRQFCSLDQLTIVQQLLKKESQTKLEPHRVSAILGVVTKAGRSRAGERKAKNHVVCTERCTFSWHAASHLTGREQAKILPTSAHLGKC